MALADFLLARIAEDEAWNHQNHGGDPTRPGSIARVKAECEAKRRIVEMRDWPGPVAANGYINAILRALALPYADHPDYSEGWKP